MLISVIVPTFDDDSRLQQCIYSLSQQSLEKHLYEVIIVNNSTREITLNLPTSGFRIIQELTPGSYSARNKGLEQAGGKFIAFTDSDCRPDTDWLENGLRALKFCGVDRVAGEIAIFPKGNRRTAVECYEEVFAFNQRQNVNQGSAVTANLFVRAKLFGKVGVFDRSLYSGGDSEWNRRASRMGYSIGFAEDAVVRHPARHTWQELSSKTKRVMGGKFSQNPSYELNFFRSISPPIEAIRTIIKFPELSTKEKLLAAAVAYRIKVFKYFYLADLKSGSVKVERQ